MPANNFFASKTPEALAAMRKGVEISHQPKAKTLTSLGEAALAYVRDPSSFPWDCPDPRSDHLAFEAYLRLHPQVIENLGNL